MLVLMKKDNEIKKAYFFDMPMILLLYKEGII